MKEMLVSMQSLILILPMTEYQENQLMSQLLVTLLSLGKAPLR